MNAIRLTTPCLLSSLASAFYRRRYVRSSECEIPESLPAVSTRKESGIEEYERPQDEKEMNGATSNRVLTDLPLIP